jgi:Protein of unknown function (DUF3035)
MRLPLSAIIISGALVLGGCASKGLRQLEAAGLGPDEFLILPNKPLTAPKDYEVLPPPTPGGANLVDQNPNADAVVALGGRASAIEANGVPSSDGTLVAQASRYGVPSNTRASLAAEDADFRKRQSRWSNFRLFEKDRYARAYRKQNLDPYVEIRRYRGAGFPTPSSPPEPN